jgi:hypothetical protein
VHATTRDRSICSEFACSLPARSRKVNARMRSARAGARPAAAVQPIDEAHRPTHPASWALAKQIHIGVVNTLTNELSAEHCISSARRGR